VAKIKEETGWSVLHIEGKSCVPSVSFLKFQRIWILHERIFRLVTWL